MCENRVLEHLSGGEKIERSALPKDLINELKKEESFLSRTPLAKATGNRHQNKKMQILLSTSYLHNYVYSILCKSNTFSKIVKEFTNDFYYFLYRVIDGLDVVDELEKLPVNPKNYRPTSETRISSVTIHANPIAG